MSPVSLDSASPAAPSLGAEIFSICFVVFTVTSCVISSMVLVRQIDQTAQRDNSGPISWWRRALIPMPMMLFGVGNLSDILSFQVYVRHHLNYLPVGRFAGMREWDSDPIINAALVGIAILPFLLATK